MATLTYCRAQGPKCVLRPLVSPNVHRGFHHVPKRQQPAASQGLTEPSVRAVGGVTNSSIETTIRHEVERFEKRLCLLAETLCCPLVDELLNNKSQHKGCMECLKQTCIIHFYSNTNISWGPSERNWMQYKSCELLWSSRSQRACVSEYWWNSPLCWTLTFNADTF